MKRYHWAVGLIAAGSCCIAVLAGFVIFPDISRGDVDQTYVRTVQQGDTLWHLAEQNVIPGTNVQREVDRIVRMNNLQSYDIAIGQKLVLPYPAEQ